MEIQRKIGHFISLALSLVRAIGVVSEIGVLAKVTDSHVVECGSIPGKSCSVLILSRAYHCAPRVLISM